jgi:predicted nucleotide-binding protein
MDHSLKEQAVLIEALKKQKIVGGNAALAEELARAGELVEVEKGTPIIEQGGADTDIYLIVAGAFDIVVNCRTVATRIPGDHVGEMAAMQPSQRRSASIVAREDSAVLKLSEPQVVDLGERYPRIWRVFAHELTDRLQQRNSRVQSIREKIRVFIICSPDTKKIAHQIGKSFESADFEVAVWAEGAFCASHYVIECLERESDQSDVAVAVAKADARQPSNCEDLAFELGFLMGRLGRHRVLLLEPRGEEVKPSSHLGGITTVTFKDGDEANLGSASKRLREMIRDLGPNR